jgi:hypothetical protein
MAPTLAELLALPADQLAAAIRARHRDLLYAPRPPFHAGAVVADDAPERFAVVAGPHTQRGYRWLGDAVVDERGTTLVVVPPTGRASVDARVLVRAAFADATAGAWLQVKSQLVADDRRWVRLADGLTIGRSRHAHVMVPSAMIAQQHCRFELRDGAWYVEDLHSTHGTYVGLRRVDRALLQGTQVLAVGGQEVVFRDTLAPPPRAPDDAQFNRWFLDRLQLGVIGAELAFEPDTACMMPARSGTVTWRLPAAVQARDARWLLASVDDASVWLDALVAREGDELASPIACDDCACFAAGERTVVIARVDRMVARVEVATPELTGDERATRAADLAACIAERAAM